MTQPIKDVIKLCASLHKISSTIHCLIHTLRRLSQSVSYVSQNGISTEVLPFKPPRTLHCWIEKNALNKDANKILRGKNILKYRHVSVIISIKKIIRNLRETYID